MLHRKSYGQHQKQVRGLQEQGVEEQTSVTTHAPRDGIPFCFESRLQATLLCFNYIFVSA